MLSRVADNLYWFGRYLNRIEGTARLVNVNASLLLDLPRDVSFGWRPLVDIVGARETFFEHYTDADEDSVVRFLLLDPRYAGSVMTSLERAREVLRVSRDTFPGELWEKLNDLYLYVQAEGERSIGRRYRREFLTRIIDAGFLISGVLLSNMNHDVGFWFLQIGTNIEQADMTTRILDTRSVNIFSHRLPDEVLPFEQLQWMSVLRSLTGYQMFRRHVRQRLTGPNVLRFLLQSREFPRSLFACLQRMQTALRTLPDPGVAERALHRPLALVADADIDALATGNLSAFVDEIQIGLGAVHDALHATYFCV